MMVPSAKIRNRAKDAENDFLAVPHCEAKLDRKRSAKHIAIANKGTRNNRETAIQADAETKSQTKPQTPNELPTPSALSNMSTVRRRYISLKIRREVWQTQNGECQYYDPQTKKKCRSRFGLELDHKTAIARGGDDTVENLQLLCKKHNLRKGSQTI